MPKPRLIVIPSSNKMLTAGFCRNVALAFAGARARWVTRYAQISHGFAHYTIRGRFLIWLIRNIGVFTILLNQRTKPDCLDAVGLLTSCEVLQYYSNIKVKKRCLERNLCSETLTLEVLSLVLGCATVSLSSLLDILDHFCIYFIRYV